MMIVELTWLSFIMKIVFFFFKFLEFLFLGRIALMIFFKWARNLNICIAIYEGLLIRLFKGMRTNELWGASNSLSLVFLSSPFLMKTDIAVLTKILLTTNTLNGAFILFAFLTNSESFMPFKIILRFYIDIIVRIFELLLIFVNIIITIRAHENLAIFTFAIYFICAFTQLTYNIHS